MAEMDSRFEIEVEQNRTVTDRFRHLDPTRRSWLRQPEVTREERYINLWCIRLRRRFLKWVVVLLLFFGMIVIIPIVISKGLPKHPMPQPPPLDEYAVALRKALLFFNAQRSGHLPSDNGISWRGDSGLKDGENYVKGGIVGGYYDGGDNIKYHYPLAFSMTLLSWSVIEYSHKYQATGEYSHVKDIIKWGADYLLLTFDSSAPVITSIYVQVGMAINGSTALDDEHYCWQRPEDIEYQRPAEAARIAPDLGSEVAAALAAASIVFRNEAPTYSRKLITAAKTAFKYATAEGQDRPYSAENLASVGFYNSSSFWDEVIWGSTWMFYATGNYGYLSMATDPDLYYKAKAIPSDISVLNWDNKLPALELLLTRLRIVLNPGYPYEKTLMEYHTSTDLNICLYLKLNRTKGGLILLNHGKPQPLQYVVNSAFLATLYADYMNASSIPGLHCGPDFISSVSLRDFATSQVDYILGRNPLNMSYVVGHGQKFPNHVHHRGASIPHDHKKYSCTGGWKWRDSKSPNPNTIIGAMVGGPGMSDDFPDDRRNKTFTEPTLAGNAGLAAVVTALTRSGGQGIEKNAMFSSVLPPV